MVESSVYKELRAIQRQHGYLPPDQLEQAAKKIGMPISRIHMVASFFPHFRLTPPPRADVAVCADMTCHLRGACDLKRRLELQYKGMGSKDVVIRDVSCLGRCDHAPAMSLNDNIYSSLDEDSAVALVNEAIAGRPLPHPKKYVRAKGARLASDLYDGEGRYEVVKKYIETRDAGWVISTLKASTLRGMGGAGFPTGLKWEIVRNAPGTEKYIVCNADESEPGTIKDRFILENLGYLVIEGMVLAGLVTGAQKGLLYIRHEYEEQQEILQEELDRCKKLGVIGRNVLGSGLTFDLELFISPGGYICGEESALLEAIEGHRAEPRNKPPFPGTHGLYQKPTVINNVETFSSATIILARGVDWYKSVGRNGAVGLKFVGISGDVNNPGIFEVPMGTPYRELIYNHAGGIAGGQELYSFAPSGPSSGYLPASMVDLPLDWNAVAKAGSMVGSGAIVVCAEGTCMLDMAVNATKFFRNESCGKCVPCRVGSQKMVDMLTGWTKGKSSPGDLELLQELDKAMRLTSICGLGQVVPVPIASVLTHFRDDVEAHLAKKQCPAGVCFRESGS